MLDPLPASLVSVLFLCCRVLPFHFSSSQVWNDLHAVLDAPERPLHASRQGLDGHAREFGSARNMDDT